MAQQIACRLNAIRCVLEQASEDSQRVAISKTQVAALAAMLRQTPHLTAVEMAELSTMACGIGLHPSSLTEALVLFVPEQHARGRRHMQDFCSVADFFTRSDWSRLLEKSTTAQAKTHVIMSRCLLLGLRCPGEPTIKLMCTLAVYVSGEGNQEDPMEFKSKLGDFKRQFKALSNAEKDPGDYIVKLPPSPADLFRLHPLAYSACYSGVGDDTPIATPIDGGALRRLNNSYKCRGAGVPAVTAIARSASSAAQPDAMIQTMMMGFAQLQASQMKMFSQLMGGNMPQQDADCKLTFAERSKKPEHVHLPGPAALHLARDPAQGVANPITHAPGLQLALSSPGFEGNGSAADGSNAASLQRQLAPSNGGSEAQASHMSLLSDCLALIV
jgi:hypothetical protein